LKKGLCVRQNGWQENFRAVQLHFSEKVFTFARALKEKQIKMLFLALGGGFSLKK